MSYCDPAEARQSAGEARRVWKDIMSQAGSRYANATLDSFRLHGTAEEQQRQESTLSHIRQFCESMPGCVQMGRNVVFLGTVGTGKDHLMIGMLREAVEACCFDIKWADTSEMFGQFKDAVGDRGGIADLMESYTKPQLLVLSDLLPVNEALTPFESEILFRLVHSRQRRLKATWVNANVLNLDDLVKLVGEKIVSRLKQGSLTLRMQWSDFRVKAE